MRTELCFQNLIDYWYRCNTEKVKEYVQDERGWDPEMVDEFKIGWAGAHANEYQYLRDSGFTHEEVISTGAFTEEGDCLWNGRYVFPYFDENKRPVYAIARTTGDKGGGGAGYDGHPDDFLAGKYAKLSHTKDYAEVDEPIWGLHTVDHSKVPDVVICEGIADAMMLDYHGFPVLSPVTTQFKSKHFNPLVELFEEKNVDNVYIIPDAEEVQETSKYNVSAGVSGALKSAFEIYERTSEVDVMITELPRSEGVRKVDVDDYLRENSKQDLARLMKESAEATQLDVYDEIASDLEKSSSTDYDAEVIEAEGQSALFQLNIRDVLPADFGGRGRNPIQHTGDSENYFVVMNDGETAYDHKRDQTFNAITYILCDIGERDPDAAEGSVSDEEIWKAWVYAKQEELITESDPVPVRAMKYFARNMGYDVDDDGMLDTDVYNTVVDSIDNIVDSGREKVDNSVREFYRNKSDYYNVDVEPVCQHCSVTSDMSGFESMDIVWTCDSVDTYLPTLALVALEEGYVDLPLEASWASELPDEVFAKLCKDARERYLFTGEPPYRAIRGTAILEDIIDWSGELGKSEYRNARQIFNSGSEL